MRNKKGVFVLFGTGLLLCLGAWTASATAHDRITMFDSDMKVGRNGALQVTETITVQVDGDKIHHGIERDIPIAPSDQRVVDQAHGFQFVSALRDGQTEPFEIVRDGKIAEVYIGDPAERVPQGRHTYELRYVTHSAIRYGEQRDALYWPVTGSGWRFPIDRARATVHLPNGATILTHAAYVGWNTRGEPVDDTAVQDNGNTAQFLTSSPLAEGEGLTITVAFPKGFVQAPHPWQTAWWYLQARLAESIALGGLLITALLAIGAWWSFGTKETESTVSTAVQLPPGISPAVAMRVFAAEGIDVLGLCAAIVGLAIKGRLTIDTRGRHVTLRPANNETPLDTLSFDERHLLSLIVQQGDAVVLSALHRDTLRAMQKAFVSTVNDEYEWQFRLPRIGFILAATLTSMAIQAGAMYAKLGEWHAPVVYATGVALGIALAITAVRLSQGRYRYALVGLPEILIGLFFIQSCICVLTQAKYGVFNLTLGVCYPLLAAVNLSYLWVMQRMSAQGSEYKAQLLTLKNHVARRDVVRQTGTAPSLVQAQFVSLLPYAMAFKSEQQWSEAYAAQQAYEEQVPGRMAPWVPSWYLTDYFNPLSPVASIIQMKATLHRAIGVATYVAPAVVAAPRSRHSNHSSSEHTSGNSDSGSSSSSGGDSGGGGGDSSSSNSSDGGGGGW